MNIELEKRLIIDELNHVNDEWLLKAIKRLLGLDYEDDRISDDHKKILDSRIDAFESGKAKLIEWDEAKKRLTGKR